MINLLKGKIRATLEDIAKEGQETVILGQTHNRRSVICYATTIYRFAAAGFKIEAHPRERQEIEYEERESAVIGKYRYATPVEPLFTGIDAQLHLKAANGDHMERILAPVCCDDPAIILRNLAIYPGTNDPTRIGGMIANGRAAAAVMGGNSTVVLPLELTPGKAWAVSAVHVKEIDFVWARLNDAVKGLRELLGRDYQVAGAISGLYREYPQVPLSRGIMHTFWKERPKAAEYASLRTSA